MHGAEYVLEFERELRVVNGLSAATVRQYSFEVRKFLSYLNKQELKGLQVDRSAFVDWRESLGYRKPAGITVAISAVKRFYRFLVQAGYVETSAFPSEMKVKVKSQTPTNVPSSSQFLSIRKHLSKCRHGLIVECLAGTGLRVSALTTMRARHLRLDGTPHISVDGTMSCKGKTAGIIPISPYCAGLLKDYISGIDRKDRLFPYSEATVWRTVKSLSPSGLHLKPHSLRHFYCAMMYYRNFDGGRFDVVWVRDAAGHSSIAVTDKYLKLAKQVCRSDTEWEQRAYGSTVK